LLKSVPSRLKSAGSWLPHFSSSVADITTEIGLYKEEFDEWERIGAVDVRYAFSKEPEKSEGCKYVQDRLWKDRKDTIELFDAGARVYVCGSRVVGEGSKQ
jgi:hypothetical protein